MDKENLSPEIIEKLDQLARKFEQNGQNLEDYLDGLLHADYLSYWDYIRLDTLLSLQNPKTAMEDEMVFITYHQISELYFKLILWEMEQLTDGQLVQNGKKFLDKVKRINRYLEQLVNSFTVMTEGMEQQQFLKFRMTLMPASGFQSVQFRMIEIYATDLTNLVHHDYYLWVSPEDPIESYMDNLYWKAGATDENTGEKSLTLRQFEEKYDDLIKQKARELSQRNLRQQLFTLLEQEDPYKDEIISALKRFDHLANIKWPLAHFKIAVRHLQGDKQMKSATGGTNWRRYLPPRFQRVIFFPELWSEEEIDDWGKSWVMEEVLVE